MFGFFVYLFLYRKEIPSEPSILPWKYCNLVSLEQFWSSRVNFFITIFIFKSFTHFRLVPHNKQAKENVMHYREMVEQGTRDTHDQIKAKEEEINTKTFKTGKYATLCRGDTSQVPVILGLCRRIGKFFLDTLGIHSISLFITSKLPGQHHWGYTWWEVGQ